MTYTYSGDAARALRDSYRADTDPFPTDNDLTFPEHQHMRREIELMKCVMFPRCWNSGAHAEELDHLGECLDELGQLFHTGIKAYSGTEQPETVDAVLDRLPEIRTALKKDVEAAYKGDPAAKSYMEVIRSYPGLHATLVHRVAHELYEAGAEEYARELSEYAKTETGIDIHPGADIGEYFFIDHGTGVVVGETARVGDWVRLYQNVTLGALHFEEQEDDEHMLKKGYKRHPDIGDHVVIGAGSNVMGAIEVGDHVSIGANSWVSEDVPDHTTVFIADHPDLETKPID